MKSTSDRIRVYTCGLAIEGTGAYTYIVLENTDCGEVAVGDARGRLEGPTILRARFSQAGPAKSEERMKIRAVYEGVRHCPDGATVEIYTDCFIMQQILFTTKPTDADGDIVERYRRYIAEHRIMPKFFSTKVYNEKDLPCNDHEEWTWWAHDLCRDAIRRYDKENKK